MKTILSLVTLAFALSGCGSSRSYELSYNGCSTGKQEFDSDQAYCDGLRSHSLNKGCAPTLRKDTYERECSGTFTETN